MKFLVEQNVLDQVLQYLVTKPYMEVAALLVALDQEIKKNPKPQEEKKQEKPKEAKA